MLKAVGSSSRINSRHSFTDPALPFALGQKEFFNILNQGVEEPYVRQTCYVRLVDCRPLAAYTEKHIWIGRPLSTAGKDTRPCVGLRRAPG